MEEMQACPLCQYTQITPFSQSENRVYLYCSNCDIVFVPKKYFISTKEEKEKYDHHQNSPKNQGYRDFLNRLIMPLCAHLSSQASGLDFGSGPGPTLSIMMEELGYKMDIYDYFYHNNPKVFEKSYDFITTTEVIEHLHNPYDEILKLWTALKSGGVLGIMTAFRPHDSEFNTWYYKRDLTHIRFFTESSFKWLANHLDAELIVPESGVVLLKKRN
jgi:SAM-dependent methyltransferase